MYGLEIEELAIPPLRNQDPVIVAHRFGYKAKFTRNRNTTFSALGLLFKSSDEGLNLKDLSLSEDIGKENIVFSFVPYVCTSCGFAAIYIADMNEVKDLPKTKGWMRVR